MTKGGYQILDFSGYKFTIEQDVHINGIFDLVKNTKKTILVSGLNIGGVELRDSFVSFVDDGDSSCSLHYPMGVGSSYVIIIGDDDLVNIQDNL